MPKGFAFGHCCKNVIHNQLNLVLRWQTDETTNTDTCHQISCRRRNEGTACRTVASVLLTTCTDCFGRNFNRIDDGLFFNAAFFEFPAHHAGKRTSAAGCFGNITPEQKGRVHTVSGSQTADERDVFFFAGLCQKQFCGDGIDRIQN